MESDPTKLIAEIEEVFAGVAYPGDEGLIETEIPEDVAAAEFFKKIRWKDWKDNPAKVLTPQCNGYLFFLSPEAFMYYLPLYMLLVLKDYIASDLLAGEVLSGVALCGCDVKLRNYTERRMSGMSPAQLNVILKYLEFFEQEHSEDFSEWPIEGAIVGLRERLLTGGK